MVKSKKSVKSQNKKRTTSKRGSSIPLIVEEVLAPVKEEPVDIKTIKIVIENLEHIEGKFDATDIHVEVSHADNFLGETEKSFLVDEMLHPINFVFEYQINALSEKELDKLFSAPLYFTIWQTLNTEERQEQEQLLNDEDVIQEKDDSYNTAESLFSNKEAILGTLDTVLTAESDDTDKKTKFKDVKKRTPTKTRKSDSSKDKKLRSKVSNTGGSKSKKDLKNMDSGLSFYSTSEADPICIGSANLDLSSLFYGNLSIEEKLPIRQLKIYKDHRIEHELFLPKLSVKISTDYPILPEDNDEKKLFNTFYFTIESIYNLPEFFDEKFNYKVATVLPTQSLNLAPNIFEFGKFQDEMDIWQTKKIWPSLAYIQNYSAQTKYEVEPIENKKLKADFKLDFKTIAETETPRVTWNVMKQTWLTENGNDYLQQLIQKFRKWPIEVFITPKPKETQKSKRETVSPKTSAEGSMKEPKKILKETKPPRKSSKHIGKETNFHYMAIADVSKLLYPGVTKTRIVCALRTFQPIELDHETGLDNSLLMPKSGVIISKTSRLGKEDNKIDGKKKSKDEKKSTKSDHTDRMFKESATELDPSTLVYNEKGLPVYIIIELELTKPFAQSRTLEELTFELSSIIPDRPPMPKNLIPISVAKNLFQKTMIYMVHELNKDYQKYYVQVIENKNDDYPDISMSCFIRYLQKEGIYQKYCTTIGRAVSMVIKEKFKFDPVVFSDYIYDNYISKVYIYLITEMNKQINTMMTCHLIGCMTKPVAEADYLYLASEALELNMPWVAERYHLESLGDEVKTAKHWFDITVYYKGQKFHERAFETCKEILALEPKHLYGLILFGVLLFEKKEDYLAETTFLALINYYPDCVEGWVCLYILYYIRGKYEGCEICTENMRKHENYFQNKPEDDYIFHTEGLGWSTAISGKTPFFQTALIFIKLNVFKMAETSLILDRPTPSGSHRYYFGVIYYLMKEYDVALKYLLKAQKMHGPDYAVNSLLGHVYFRLQNYEEAKECYEFVIYAYNRPEDMHMLYINLALIYESECDYEKAKMYLLIVCKISPTPYSWLLLGVVYYKMNKILEAEACLTESNILDNRLPETWAYLTLVNIKLEQFAEAQQCYSQMIKFDLKDDSLLSVVECEITSIRNEDEEIL